MASQPLIAHGQPPAPGDVLGPFSGYHRDTYAVRLDPDSLLGLRIPWLKVHEPRAGAPWLDRKCFRDEHELLASLNGRMRGLPETARISGAIIQRFIEGRTLGRLSGADAAVPEWLLPQIVGVFRHLAAVPPQSLRLRPTRCGRVRIRDGDTARFLYALIRFTEREVLRVHWPRFEPLFRALRVPKDGLLRLVERLCGLHPRPFRLLHGDLHRENFVIDSDRRLWIIDWELACIGDPLYDLATHLHLMRYPPRQEQLVTAAWAEAVAAAGGPALTSGWEADLPVLLDYKRVQSVYTDIVRQALRLQGLPETGAAMDRELALSARTVRGVLRRAAPVLGLQVPPDALIRDAYAAGLGLRLGRGTWPDAEEEVR